MTHKKVLVIAYYFPPMGLSGVQRTLKFVKYLPEFGWKPIVLTTGSGSYYAFDESQLDEIEDVNIYRTEGEGIQKSDFPSTVKQKIGRYIYGWMLQPDSKISWKKKAIAKAESVIKSEKPDVIYSTVPPFTSHLIAKELSEKHNIPYIVDYRDLWVDNPFNIMPTKFHKHYNRKLEADVLRKASKAIVISRKAKEVLLKEYKFLKHSDVDIIPHGYDKKDFEDLNYILDDKKLVITHSGMFQDDRNPKPFFKAYNRILNEVGKNQIELRLVGLMRKNHMRLIKKLGIVDSVKITGNVSHKEAVKNLMESDVLWLLQNDTVRTPGKLYEYFGTGKPILASVPKGDIRDLAVSSNVALTAEPDDENDIYKALKTFYELWKGGALPKGDEIFIEQFDRKNLTEKLSHNLSYISRI